MRSIHEVPPDPQAAEKLRAAEAKLNRLLSGEREFAVRFMMRKVYPILKLRF